MPSTYAHYRMGLQVRGMLEKKEKQWIEAYPELYQIGLHGPDLLFYYQPLGKNPVNQLGYTMHDQSGLDFFTFAAQILREHPDEPAYWAYVCGYLCHFALDVCCHAYVDEKIRQSGISHSEIEVEFDRMLLLKDGLNPVSQRLTHHLHASRANGEIIQAFYPSVTARQAEQAIRQMIFYCDLLCAPSRLKRGLLFSVLKLAGQYDSIHGMVVNYQANPGCTDSNQELYVRYQKARALAVRLIRSLPAYVDGSKAWPEQLQYTFGGVLPGKDGSQ